MDEEEQKFHEVYERTMREDQKAVSGALDKLIDSVSIFKGASRIDELKLEDFSEMLENLDFTKFVVSGVMYQHGLPYCGHLHDEEEGDDEDDDD